ncbi:alpha-2C adrenergic receptor-like [Haliotis cracherodii]|uniref:alpha-2C adrenergic receptor-like n=1 Tax=Haliotis cracherodii TaxID=6455 RepID=UPI0039EB941A
MFTSLQNSLHTKMTTTGHHVLNATPTIDQLNDERRLFQQPVVVTLGVIMVAAIFGNVLVIYVYLSKKMTPSYFFILLLAAGDLINSTLCIPFQMFDLSNPYKYPVPVACKIFRFLETVVNTWCGLILMCIAFDRYFKICHPLQKYTMGKAKSLAIVMFAMTISVSWPQLFLVGKRTVTTSVKDVFGEDCSTQDGLFGSVYSLLFQGAISFLFGVCFLIFLLFYGRMFHVIWRRKRQRIGESYSFTVSSGCEKMKGADDKNKRTLSVMEDTSFTAQNDSAFPFENIDQNSNGNIGETNSIVDGRRPSTSDRKMTNLTESFSSNLNEVHVGTRHSSVWSLSMMSQRTPSTPLSAQSHRLKFSSQIKIRTSRTTVMFGLVTLAGVFGFLPYLLVEVLRQSGVAFQPGMTNTEDLMYEFLSKSYFLNNIANPLIYSAVNPLFRKDSRKVLRKLIKCKD